MSFQGVLGTEGFLDKFAVNFNKYYEYFVVERPDDFHQRVGRHLTIDPTRTTDHRWLGGRPPAPGKHPYIGDTISADPSSARR
jgi:hypothetical protein